MSFVAMLRPDLLFATQVAQGGSPQDDNSLKSDQQKNSESTSATAGTKDKAKRRLVSMNGGSVRLDIAQWPLVGSLNAKYVFVEMFDYSCSHCRKTHWAIKGAAEKLGGDLAVVVLPVPLNASCNNSVKVTSSQFIESCEIAELAVSVWRIDATKFAAFHNWMFAGDKAPTFAKAKAHAETLINEEKLVAELSSKVPSQYIAKNVELYKRAGSGNVPKLIFPRTTIVGEFTSIDALVDVILRETK
jgi:protein-disulfide isomerase